jgi:hypothetical protein
MYLEKPKRYVIWDGGSRTVRRTILKYTIYKIKKGSANANEKEKRKEKIHDLTRQSSHYMGVKH